MHELAITESLVDLVAEEAGDARVVRVVLEIGELSGVSATAVRGCFEACAEGTVLEGAELEVVAIGGRGRCRLCGAESDMTEPFAVCPCGAPGLEVVRGAELRLREVEVI